MKPTDLRRIRKLADTAERLRALYDDARRRDLIAEFGIRGNDNLRDALLDFIAWQDLRIEAAERTTAMGHSHDR